MTKFNFTVIIFIYLPQGREIAIIEVKDFFTKVKTKRFLVSLVLFLVAALLTTAIYLKIKTITVVIDGKQTKIITFKNTVQKALSEKKISVGSKDKIEPALDAQVSDKDIITIKRAVNINVSVDGEELNVLSAEENVDSMLKAEGIKLRDQDKLNVDKETKLSDGMQLEIVRVDTRTFTDLESLSFNTVVKTNSGLPNTYRKVVQEGKDGEAKITSNVTYENGKEVVRKILDKTVFKKPTDKIIVQGTYPLMPVSRGGDPIPYTRVFRARATAYSPTGGRTTAYTASGRRAVRDPNGYSTIAVDPRVIPLGTKVFVEGYGFAIAADTGSAVIGNTIDLFFDTYRETTNWAVKYVNCYVLK